MSTTRERTRPRSRWTADRWNERYPVGTPVEYRTTWGQQAATLMTRTSTRAWMQPDRHPVVMIDGRSGAVALWALKPLPRPCPTCEQARWGAKEDPRTCSHCRHPFPEAS